MVKLTLELIDQIAPDPGPEPIYALNCYLGRFYNLDQWKLAKEKRDELFRIYETERLYNIITGKERPFPCNTLIE